MQEDQDALTKEFDRPRMGMLLQFPKQRSGERAERSYCSECQSRGRVVMQGNAFHLYVYRCHCPWGEDYKEFALCPPRVEEEACAITNDNIQQIQRKGTQ